MEDPVWSTWWGAPASAMASGRCPARAHFFLHEPWRALNFGLALQIT